MSIVFKQTIIHNLDLSNGMPIISQNPVVLTDETESFITKKIISVIENTGIEIKMPTHLFKDNDFFEMVNEPNGTITLKIKNVSQVLNK